MAINGISNGNTGSYTAPSPPAPEGAPGRRSVAPAPAPPPPQPAPAPQLPDRNLPPVPPVTLAPVQPVQYRGYILDITA
ncbi:hypothetical protein [Niveispirillum sp.]|uniref:hypothetical protein n=1 Tax=Niveispirillum sp. TaxID=1917217 RepID=UPI001B564E89|nr:hypothetical protein [Niveispirillum sp.]MBP7339709.1 hypothetical protein [Niveispirillum sp.]